MQDVRLKNNNREKKEGNHSLFCVAFHLLHL